VYGDRGPCGTSICSLGPGKLTAAFEITSADNGMDLLSPDSLLRIEPGWRRFEHRGWNADRAWSGQGPGEAWRFLDGDLMAWASKPHL